MDPPRPHPDWPLVVAYGLGVNSTAMLVEFAKRGIKPDETERKPSREAFLDAHFFCYWYPLACDWNMDRAACEESIRDAGLPVPPKSACWFCPASKKHEIVWLREHHPELLERALAIEENAKPNLTTVVGLGRSFSWADFLDDLDDTPLFDCGT